MSRFIFFLRQMISGPLSMLAGPFSFIGETYSRSRRGKAFILALPALFMIFFGGTLLLASQLGRENRLIQKYDDLAQNNNRKVESLLPDFARAHRLFQLELMKGDETQEEIKAIMRSEPSQIVGQTGGSSVDEQSMTSSEKSFRKLQSQIRQLRNSEMLYLQKLIDLAPNDGTYKYRYALAHLPLDSEVVPDLMSALAPVDVDGMGDSNRIGNPEAHLWLARFFAERPKANDRDVKLAMMMVEKHSTRCLVVDPANRGARELRAQVHFRNREYSRAYDDFLALFEMDPRYFASLIQVNKLINREAKNPEVLDQAAARLHRELVSNRDNVADWETAWEQYADCMMQRKLFSRLQKELQLERDMFATDELKRNFLNSILVSAFSRRVNELQATADQNPVDLEEIIQILETAASSDGLNDFLKFHCTLLVRNNPVVAARARAVYDYEQDPDPAGLVLHEIAKEALGKGDIARAIEVLEKARSKLPGNPPILNNLAWAYLSRDNSSSEKALELVEQAIRLIQNQQIAKEELSSYLHTRGVALIRLNRIVEAEGALLEALRGRPDHLGILEALVVCYEGRDPIQKEIFQRELDRVRAAAGPTGENKQ